MIALLNTLIDNSEPEPYWHRKFIQMLPKIRCYAEMAFQNYHYSDQEEFTAEVLANCLVSFVKLVKQGREELAYPTVLVNLCLSQNRT